MRTPFGASFGIASHGRALYLIHLAKDHYSSCQNGLLHSQFCALRFVDSAGLAFVIQTVFFITIEVRAVPKDGITTMRGRRKEFREKTESKCFEF